MKSIINIYNSRQFKHVCKRSYPIQDLKRTTISTNLVYLPKFNNKFIGFTFRNTCSPNLNSLGVLPLYTWLFSLSCTACKFYLILTIFTSIYLSNFRLITTMFVGLSQLTGVLHFLPYEASNGLIFNEVWYPLL